MNIIDKIFGVIAPNDCIGCEREGLVICDECVNRLKDAPSSCYRCHKISKNFRPCPDHVSKFTPNHVYMAVEYKELAKDFVRAYKFDQKREASTIMAEHINSILPYFASEPLVTYVPASGTHIRERGYDHAKLIAIELAKIRNYRYAPLLVRVSKVDQIGSTRKDRLVQLNNAFRLINNKYYKNKHILLIDDVVTTGATIDACTKILKQNGHEVVDVSVFARTPKLVNGK